MVAWPLDFMGYSKNGGSGWSWVDSCGGAAGNPEVVKSTGRDLRANYFATKLHLRRLLQPPVRMEAEGCAPWEMSYLHTIEMCRHFAKERLRPRNYTKHGLQKTN